MEQGDDGFKARRYPPQPQQQAYPTAPPPQMAYAYQSPPPIPLGTVCIASNGLHGFGNPRPLGAFCQIMTPYGPVPGQIIQ